MLLAGAELATAVPEVSGAPLLSGAVLMVLCAGEVVAAAEELLAEEEALADEDALAEEDVDLAGAAAVLAAAFGLLLVQLPWVSELVVALAEEADAVVF